ncbi:hypothetical protein GCM10027036_11600 [Flavihumibacter cheonanensis]|uniref:hypothetical protein n=1 Tax=Flavihumibacter cheonanensis TaxID=1442385 RepID=UPI001EF98519|nr:hypothetical protein [Flavihumibacter cheonanensis]MCG7751399.1 hypothetical protein [Flavihumibacter cheonanensis]
MSTALLQEKTMRLPNGTGWPYLEEDLGSISIYPSLIGSNNAFTFFQDQYLPEKDPTTYRKLERATLQIRLSMQLPEATEQKTFIRTNTELKLLLKEGTTNRLLLEKTFSGTATSLQGVLDAKAGNALLLAIQQKKSGLSLHLVSDVVDPGSQHQYRINSKLQLEELIRAFDQFQVQFKYFDPAYNNYRLIPEQIKTSDKTRAIQTTAAGKMEKGKILNASFAQVAAVALPLPVLQKQDQLKYDNRIKLHLLNNWSIAISGAETIKNYPIVTDDSSQYWLNRWNQQEVLILTEPLLAIPNLQTPPEQAGFRFLFRNTGLTDSNGKPILEGSLQVTLSHIISESVKAKAEAAFPGKGISAIQFDQISYLLTIPYVNDAQETVNLQLSPGKITMLDNGQTQLVFHLLNNAIRMCYAAISGTQPKLKLQVAMAFSGYSKLEPQLLQLNSIVGTKLSLTKLNRGVKPAWNNRIETLLQPVVLAQLIEPAVQYKIQSYVRSKEVDLHFPCTEFGAYFQEESGGVLTAVGCKEAYKLGEVSAVLYTPIPSLESDQYKVYRSTNVPNEFLVVPTQYIIGRQSVEDNGRQLLKPMILLYSTLDAVSGTSKWVLDATLIPDMSLIQRHTLKKACAKLTPYPPQIQYLTEIPMGTSEAVVSLDQMTGTTTNIYPYGEYLRMTIETDISSILILLEMLKRDAINGLLSINLPEQEKYSTRIVPSLQQIGGEWNMGHCVFSYDGKGKLKLSNQTECRLQLSGITGLLDLEEEEEMELAAEMDAFGELEKTVPELGYQGFIADYRLVDPVPVELEQINQYIEDVQCQVIFICTSDLKEAGLATIEISFKLKGQTEPQKIELSAEERSQEVYIQMPVTHFLMERIIEYKISKLVKTDNSETIPTTGYSEQDLSEKGNFISINL